ncbi:phage head closure protein [Mangrovibrevibacter kandeliae]|uniref:phage head closure protein n=1 Tax=Mangrovibrevibacter kandeliae TaxID=2968473 RepID=UPI002119B2D5|nr:MULTISPECIES: phage head closure protein [unclassified Aurantimonas]MCQ8781080.1 phage head closure protein [Aurantimonas sp. CSK15Z-1]MCW4113861.1 phage head closure protein [Aurantimonas sp. MSK8Z-1]
MAPLFLDPGLLRRRAVLETCDPAADCTGDASDAWREIAELSVHVEPLSVESRERFEQREATITHRVVCRHRSDVDRGMAFRIGVRRLVIRSVHDPDETGRYLVCRCEEAT